MNSFFATVEQQDNPTLRGKPVAVGGRPGTRSIVAAASMEAKRWGVKTAMSTAEALAVCPSLILVPGRSARYQEISEQVTRQIIHQTPDVEIFSIDECFADISAVVGYRVGPGADSGDKLRAAVDIACDIKGDIRRQVGDYLSCSVGLAPNKILAKLASDTFKPDGLHIIKPATTERRPLIADRHPLTADICLVVPATGPRRSRLKISTIDELTLGVQLDEFCGLGPRLTQHLARLGITTPAQLRRADVNMLRRAFGVVGERLQQYVWGIDERPVAVHYEQPPEKSLSHAVTLPATRWRPREARRFLYQLCAKLGRRLRRRGWAGRRITTFLRFTDFTGRGWHQTYHDYVRDDQTIYELATANFDRLTTFKPIRLVGVGISLLARSDQLTLPLLPEDQRRDRLTTAQDLVNDRFGERVITRAAILATKNKQAAATTAFGWRFKE